MGIYLNPGNDNFKMALRSKIYVDKTELIKYTNGVMDTEMRYLCVSRPRRFGKSMAANMLCAYYGRGWDSLSLFQDRKIGSEETFQEHLNQYDVIFLNIQQFLRGAKELAKLVPYIEDRVLEELREAYPDAVRVGERNLPDALASVYSKDKREQRGFIFIIDEWDCIFREAKDQSGVQKEYLDLLQDLLKDRAYVKLAYMTGILPIKKYGTHKVNSAESRREGPLGGSALNIFDEFSMTDPKCLAPFFGFTGDEVADLCESNDIDLEEAEHWYDGYRFPEDLHIYNPRSIVDLMHHRKFKSYWTRTETYEALKLYIDMDFDGLKEAVAAMLGGISCRINPERFQNDMTSFNDKDDILTLLVHLGYLAYEEKEQKVYIPNLEIAGEFGNAVAGDKGWGYVSAALAASDRLLQATLEQDGEAVAKGIDIVHMENTSILSYNDENALSCVITLAYYSARKDYTLIRELPAGKGFADMVFLPRKGSDRPALLVELKWDQSAQGAIDQIKDRRYAGALATYQGEVLLVGINYQKKTKAHSCRIEKIVGDGMIGR
ncbi:MAG: AAA family ATPase [Lachnospiraceae bacterium]|nr:AAA family ATPase [Lachnospiraceae bacterium]